MSGAADGSEENQGGTVSTTRNLEVPVHARFALLAALVALAVPAAAAPAPDAAESFRFGTAPQRVIKGQTAAITVVVRPTGVFCAAAVRYADASVQRLARVRARNGKATWRFKVPAGAKPGSAAANVACGKAGKGMRRFIVAAPPAAPAPAKVTVRASGFSQRVRGTSRSVSYGIELANPSPEIDALDVTVLVNFIDPTGRVVDTDTSRVAAVGAATVYYLGGSTTIPDASPVDRIEIVTRVAGKSPKRKLGPAFADILVQAKKSDPAWVGAVVGQIENDHPTMLVRRASVSAVIYDSGGAILGGATGRMGETLVPGVRAYFQAGGGADSIPFDRAFSASVSTIGTYEPTA
jgi:hypothetical protein